MKIFDFCVEAPCWIGIIVIIMITLDVMQAEITYNDTTASIPPITVKGD
jgi:hypothetical protein